MRHSVQTPNATRSFTASKSSNCFQTPVGRFSQSRSTLSLHPPAAVMLQPKLSLSEPGDEHEQEADRFADQVMRMPDRKLQRASDDDDACPKCQKDENDKSDGLLQTKSVGSNKTSEMHVPDVVDEVLATSGQPLDSAARDFMETRFGHDFSRVRVHTDARAAESARSLNSLAYTVGQDLVFNNGEYRPGTSEGKRLLAHELTHVLQQRSSPALQRYTVPSSLACNEVVPWMDKNSPYQPEWAATKCNFQFTPTTVPFDWKPKKGGTVEATVSADKSRTVDVDCPIDRPEWSPGARVNKDAEASAFSAMRRTLDAHEAAHQKIGKTWKATLESRYQAMAYKLTAADKDDAAVKVSEKSKALTDTWGADAQKAQTAIDPFRDAVLACP